MNVYIYPTDQSWYDFLSSAPNIDEVDFWRPGGKKPFNQLVAGDLLLFRLHSPINAIAGGGFYVHFSFSTVAKAWEAFGPKNGTADYDSFLSIIAKHKKLRQREAVASSQIGCIVLAAPFFLPPNQWIPVPPDYSINNPEGAKYDAAHGTGKVLLKRVTEIIRLSAAPQIQEWVSGDIRGELALVRRRIGQGAFRMLVSDIYGRRCSVTGERTFPVLEAAHIIPVAAGGQHRPDNGLLLRSDVHTLFDLGYATITPQGLFRVSQKLTEEWQNGRVYYNFDRTPITLPTNLAFRPAKTSLEWHNDVCFRK